ncbi:MAG: hypothetical protein AAB778_01830 [Patescibacteria group bacterium]
MQDQVAVKPKSKFMDVVKLIFSVLIVFVLGAGTTAFAITKYPESLGLSKGQAQAQAEVDVLIAEVGKLLALPSDEKPTVATITDVEKLKEQTFFKNAMNNDKVLIYTKAKKAILYRPSENKIVEVGAVNINQQPQQPKADNNFQTVAPVESPVAP